VAHGSGDKRILERPYFSQLWWKAAHPLSGGNHRKQPFVRVAGQGPDGPLLVEAVSYLVVQRGNVKMNE
jgi:hypothetical protein